MSGAGQVLSAGLGSAAATRPDTAIRNAAERLQELVGRGRSLIAEVEGMRSRLTGYYNEEEKRPVDTAREPQTQEHRCDMDELMCQVGSAEDVIERLARHVQEMQSL